MCLVHLTGHCLLNLLKAFFFISINTTHRMFFQLPVSIALQTLNLDTLIEYLSTAPYHYFRNSIPHYLFLKLLLNLNLAFVLAEILSNEISTGTKIDNKMFSVPVTEAPLNKELKILSHLTFSTR